MAKRPTKRPRGWQAKKKLPKAGRSVSRPLIRPFDYPDGPRKDSAPWRGE